MTRHELTDEQWAIVVPLIPKRTARTGRPPSDPRLMLNGILWSVATGAAWRDLDTHFGPWQTVYHYFSKWRQEGVYDQILEALHIRLNADGKIDWELWCIDGSSVRATRAAAGASKKVADGIPKNPKITPLAAREAGSAASSIWSQTVAACP